MKGTFTLNKVYSGRTTYLTFGKLGTRDVIDLDSSALLNARPFRQQVNMVSRIIAHDVVEHTAHHRTAKSVSLEEELMAVGASRFVRPAIDMSRDIGSLTSYIYRKLKPLHSCLVPREHNMELDEISAYLSDAESEYHHNICTNYPDVAKLASDMLAWINYGYAVKSRQFNGCQYSADAAFNFIKDNITYGLLADLYDSPAEGLSITFDTAGELFRVRNKYTSAVLDY